jgi:hypothetical protein
MDVPQRKASMSIVSPPSVASAGASQRKALRAERVEFRGTFGAFRRPSVVGVSDDVAYATKVNARSARRAEKNWLRSLSAEEKSLLRGGHSLA